MQPSPNADVRGLRGGQGRARSVVKLMRHWPWPMLVSYTDHLRASPPLDCVLWAAFDDMRRTGARLEKPSPAAEAWQVKWGMHRRCARPACRRPFVPVKAHQRFCSGACRHAMHSIAYRDRKRGIPLPRRGHCARCERPFVRSAPGQAQRFCSPACNRTYHSRIHRGQPGNEAEFRAWQSRASMTRAG